MRISDEKYVADCWSAAAIKVQCKKSSPKNIPKKNVGMMAFLLLPDKTPAFVRVLYII